ncbi:MAG: hypothetical protein R3Y43_06205 [Alphaproteobacteria bacterium]
MKKILVIFMIVSFFSFNLKADDSPVWSGDNQGGVVVLPKALAEYCKLTEDDAKKMSEVTACVNKILTLKGDSSPTVTKKAMALTKLIFKQSVLSSVAEGLSGKIYASKYPKDVLEELSTSLENAQENKEFIGNIMILEKEGVFLQNNILMIKAAEMQFNAANEINNNKGKF